MTNNDRPIALEAYQALAERYSRLAESKAENAYLEQPAMRKCIGAVDGLCILDAGCGPGILAQHLISLGAKVTGFDLSPKMIEYAQRRTQGRGEFFVADMAQPLPQVPAAGFDLVVSSLAIDYVRDWMGPLREFHRVLKPKGRLIFSVQHPMGAFNWYRPPTPFGVHYAEGTWRGFGGEPVVVPDHYRSFEEMINPLVRSGFRIDGLVETKPVEELKNIDPEHFEKYHRQTSFMVFEASKT